MVLNPTTAAIALAFALPCAMLLGCETGGIGDPCLPEQEFAADFSGFAIGEVNVESRSFQCESRICLVNNFQGRVSCPYGQRGTAPSVEGVEDPNQVCVIPGGNAGAEQDLVIPPVSPWRRGRQPNMAVYCSCRCNGPDPNARYCECPGGFSCEELVPNFGADFGGTQLAGSYCVRSGTAIDSPLDVPRDLCELDQELACGPETGPL
jgi:hypothetical protein